MKWDDEGGVPNEIHIPCLPALFVVMDWWTYGLLLFSMGQQRPAASTISFAFRWVVYPSCVPLQKTGKVAKQAHPTHSNFFLAFCFSSDFSTCASCFWSLDVLDFYPSICFLLQYVDKKTSLSSVYNLNANAHIPYILCMVTHERQRPAGLAYVFEVQSSNNICITHVSLSIMAIFSTIKKDLVKNVSIQMWVGDWNR
jgi:hypothetical protein